MHIRSLERKLSRLEYLLVVSGRHDKKDEYIEGLRQLFGDDTPAIEDDEWNLQRLLGKYLRQYSNCMHSKR